MQKQKAPIPIPAPVCGIIGRLNRASYEAWAVGGCVRDSLLGRTPHDWDLCTSALPEQVAQVFRGERLLPTGLAHGTQTLLEEGSPYEITTYRVELGYSDGRHPDAVAFTPSLTEDLARRDFTVNAMACHPTLGLADPFGGQADLQAGVLRAVGDPEQRFSEDALRILRALRFAAVYGLTVEEHTARAARTLAPRLALVSRERVTQELWKLLAAPDGVAAARVLRQFPEVVREILPELAPCMGFDQHSAWHQYDVWEHQLHALEAVQANTPEELPLLRLAVLIHDIGKPETFQLGPDGQGHFYGHGKAGAALAQEMLTRRLRLPIQTRQRVALLVERHDVPLPPTPKAVRRALAELGPQAAGQLAAVHLADLQAHDLTGCNGERLRGFLAETREFAALLEEETRRGACVSLKDLAVNGADLINLGYAPGPALGAALNGLLARVVDGSLENRREALLAEAEKMKSAGAMQ